MAHEIHYEPGPNIVVLDYSGDISLDEIFSGSEKAWRVAQSKDCLRFLSIFLDAKFNLTADQILEVHKHLEEIGVSKEIRSAILVPTTGSASLEVQIHEYAAGTEGWRTQLFYDRDQALEWLTSWN
ncbi:MAG: hypothetical protein ACWGOV_04410 [Acidiferrobacterales bacterium]